MATIITSYIGADAATVYPDAAAAGRCFTTFDAWKATIPLDLISNGVRHVGKLRNQKFAFTGTALSLSSSYLCNSDCYIELTADDGCSVFDLGDAPLRYDDTRGARVETTGNAFLLNIQCSYFRLSRIQFNSTSTGSSALPALYIASANKADIDRCLFEGYAYSSSYQGIVFLSTLAPATAHAIRNSVVIQKTAQTTASIAKLTNGSSAYNCTLVSLGATVASGVIGQSATGTLKNCYIGGVVAPESGVAFSKVTCFSSVATSGYTTAAMDATTFQSVTLGSHDLRLKAGSPLINAGTTEATYAATGIYGTARPSGAAYDVGAYEYVAPPQTVTLVGAASSQAATSSTGAVTVTSPPKTVTLAGAACSQAAVSASAAVTVHTPATITLIGASASQGAASATGLMQVFAGAKLVTLVGAGCSQSATCGTGIVTVTAPVAGKLTLPPLKNNAGTLLANQTGITVMVYNVASGDRVVTKTGVSTNASGVLSVSDLAITVGVQYRVIIVMATAAEGMDKAVATA